MNTKNRSTLNIPKNPLGIFLVYLMRLLHVPGNYPNHIGDVGSRVGEIQ
jgi:hypothetical protein